MLHRFYAPPDSINDGMIHFGGEESHHISHVMRLSKGDTLVAFDGLGNEYVCEIFESNKEAVIASIITTETLCQAEATLKITLFQGLPKSGKMDFIVQKCTELGVGRIVPITSSRTVVKLTGEKRKNKVSRWQRIADEAAKQSNRVKIPQISQVASMEESFKCLDGFDLVIIPWERETANHLKTTLKSTKPASIGVFIGSEGGFSHKEIENAKKKGIVPVSLGPRILRTETAGLVTLAIVLYEYGEI